MNKVYGCIDGTASTAAVIDWAAWSAQRLDVPLELLHVLERHPEQANQVTDFSGAIGLGAQSSLLQALSALDEQRSKLAQEAGRQLLASAWARAAQAGVAQPGTRLRHGELVDTVVEMEPDARLFVLGQHRRASSPSMLHLDHRVEHVIRSVKRPVLVVTNDRFEVPQRFVLAYDGSPTARKAVETVARSPLLAGLPARIVMAGSNEAQARDQLDEAQRRLSAAGFDTDTAFVEGEADVALPSFLKTQQAALVVMGAYGHSRLRSFIMGSTTTTLLRLSEAPVLILR